jgi:hypothetical protein
LAQSVEGLASSRDVFTLHEVLNGA